jgi:predicted phage terminase large subunit-like protein
VTSVIDRGIAELGVEPVHEYAARAFEIKVRKWRTPGDMARDLDDTTGRSPALDLIDEELRLLMDDLTAHNALGVFMPPQEGKSQRVSRRLPEWLLEHDPSLRIAIIGYEQDMALRWGRDIKRDIQQAPELDISIRPDSSAAGRWETPEGGGVYCVGIGGPLTGRPVDVLIIDDPVKDRAAAESPTIRESTWDWWESVALTRLAPGGKVIIIQTRWHEDDLSGRIQSRPSPLRWKWLIIPAIASDKVQPDPLGRAVGEEMVSVRGREPGHFRNLQANMSAYTFGGIYQQTPSAPEGNFFRRATFRYWRQAEPWPGDFRERISLDGLMVTLTDCWLFGTVDVAASVKTTADYTVISIWAVSPEGHLILMDRARDHVTEHDHFHLADPLLQRWRPGTLYVEQTFFASTLIEDARNAGYPVAPVRADTDKVTRAIPAAGRVHSGKVWFPAEAAWLDEWCDELAGFPTARNDDQVDTLSYAARIMSHEWTPAAPPVGQQRDAVQEALDRALGAATGNGHHEQDFMNRPL